MNWKLEWKWETASTYGGTCKYFKNEAEARENIKTLKSKHPHRKITSMTLTYTIIII